MTMTMGGALIELEKHGSDSDPVWFNRMEWSIADLIDHLGENGDARGLHIRYVSGNGPCQGTLSGMVKDRKGMNWASTGRKRRLVKPAAKCNRNHSWTYMMAGSTGDRLHWCSKCGVIKHSNGRYWYPRRAS